MSSKREMVVKKKNVEKGEKKATAGLEELRSGWSYIWLEVKVSEEVILRCSCTKTGCEAFVWEKTLDSEDRRQLRLPGGFVVRDVWTGPLKVSAIFFWSVDRLSKIWSSDLRENQFVLWKSLSIRFFRFNLLLILFVRLTSSKQELSVMWLFSSP